MRNVITGLVLLASLLAISTVQAACWSPAPAVSKISFKIDQAGAPMKGAFTDYSGIICIDAKNPSADRIQVKISMTSVDTQLPELTKALRGPDFFDVAQWPNATFISDTVHKTGPDQYEVDGKLTLSNVTRQIKVPFTLHRKVSDSPELTGQLTIKRLDYNIGLGQWKNTQWVGNQVNISFNVSLKPEASKN